MSVRVRGGGRTAAPDKDGALERWWTWSAHHSDGDDDGDNGDKGGYSRCSNRRSSVDRTCHTEPSHRQQQGLRYCHDQPSVGRKSQRLRRITADDARSPFSASSCLSLFAFLLFAARFSVVVSAANVLEVLQGISSPDFTLKQMTSFLTNSTIPIADVRTALTSSDVTLLAFTDSVYNDAASTSLLRSFLNNIDALAGLLMYHVIPSKVNVSSSDLPAKSFIKTMLSPDNLLNALNFGQNQTIVVQRTQSSGTLLTTGSITASILAGYPASNGYVFVVDAVIIPPLSLVSTYKDTLALSGYSNFINAATITNDANNLQSITIFVPSNNGIFDFQTRHPSLTLTSDVRAALIEALIIPGVYYSTQLSTLAANTALTTYLANATITVKNGSTIAANPQTTETVTITIPDVLIDAGVIHVVSSFVLADIIASGKLPTPLPTLTQIYPSGYGPVDATKFGSDFPIGAVAGGAFGGLVVIILAVIFFLVIRRRRRILRRQKQLEEEEAQYDADAEGLENEEFESDGEDDAGDVTKKESVDISDLSASNTAVNSMEGVFSPHSKAGSKRSSKRMSRIPSAVGASPNGANGAKNDEHDDDDDDEEEDEEDVRKAMAEARRIMEYRRSQWSNGDSRRSSSGGPKRDSVVSSGDEKTSSGGGGGGNSNRRSVVSSKRLSQLPLPEVSDPKEKKRESVRNSWWSATGVGAGVTDPAVLEAQARREEERASWWTGDGALAAPSTTGSDKRRSVVSNSGSRSGNDSPTTDRDRRRSVLDGGGGEYGGKRRSVVEGGDGGKRRSALGGESPAPAPPDMGKRSMTAGSRAGSRAERRSWWSAAAGNTVSEEDEVPELPAGYKVELDGGGRNLSAPAAAAAEKRKSRASYHSKRSNEMIRSVAEGDSALAMVVGGGGGGGSDDAAGDGKKDERQS
ncbi:hypothetical protein DFJ73DRAFT_799771 [Zopfochytrium polystomum]|nr:hypothetical protein DFJ73DRAFT_799771 [Zopfochytrium polystomum]